MRGLKTWVFLALCLTIVPAGGCGEKDLSNPPKILYGRDVCAQCRMIIQEERFAAAAVSADRRYLKFDDIGCMAEYERKQSTAGPGSWVQDSAGAGWIAKDRAFFVYFRDLVTPMGYGFAAFASANGAHQFVAEKGGRIITWNELKKMEEVKNEKQP